MLGVGGGIAAYKACELVRLLRESGCAVRVVPTQSALRFVGSPTWEALSGQPVTTEVWDDVNQVAHVRLGKEADLVIVAPATANVLARAACGQADDLLTATLLTTRAPVVFAPAMHTEMWEHPATQENVATLRRRGAIVIEPANGRLTGVDSGPGRLPEAISLASVCTCVLDRGSQASDLTGVRVLISAGGTREPLDPVRFLGNRSSGRQAWALASAAVARGASVQVIAANIDGPDPAGAVVEHVSTAAQLRDRVIAAAADADVVVMAAAVADFRPSELSETKIKKDPAGGSPDPIRLVRTIDVLAELGSQRTGDRPILVGFAAETVGTGQELVELASEKLAAKGADLIVANGVGADKAFESALNAVTIIGPSGTLGAVELAAKEHVANAVLDRVVELLSRADATDSPDRK